MEREQHQTEIRDLQDQLSEMHDELDSAKQSEDREKGALIEVSWGWRCGVGGGPGSRIRYCSLLEDPKVYFVSFFFFYCFSIFL